MLKFLLPVLVTHISEDSDIDYGSCKFYDYVTVSLFTDCFMPSMCRVTKTKLIIKNKITDTDTIL